MMTRGIVNVMGLELERWKYKSCTADFGVSEEENWASLYFIESKEKGKGHATALLHSVKHHYENEGKKVVGSIALNQTMRNLYNRIGIKELTKEKTPD